MSAEVGTTGTDRCLSDASPVSSVGLRPFGRRIPEASQLFDEFRRRVPGNEKSPGAVWCVMGVYNTSPTDHGGISSEPEHKSDRLEVGSSQATD